MLDMFRVYTCSLSSSVQTITDEASHTLSTNAHITGELKRAQNTYDGHRSVEHKFFFWSRIRVSAFPIIYVSYLSTVSSEHNI